MQHTQLANGAWKKLSFVEQMANIGSEVERTIRWKQKNQKDFSHKAFVRAFELISLTIDCHSKNPAKLKELTRLRECLADNFAFENEYQSTDQNWHKYFYVFNYAARVK